MFDAAFYPATAEIRRVKRPQEEEEERDEEERDEEEKDEEEEDE